MQSRGTAAVAGGGGGHHPHHNNGVHPIDRQENLLKIIVVGEPGIGKSCTIKRYVDDTFDANYKITMGVDFHLKILKMANQVIKLQLWDVAGQERFGPFLKVYFREAAGAIVVFDITSRSTFDRVPYWKNMVVESCSTIPCVLLANKCDLKKPMIADEEIEQVCKDLGFVAWYKCSALDGMNIPQGVQGLVNAILEEDRVVQPQQRKTGQLLVTDNERQPVQENADNNSFCGGLVSSIKNFFLGDDGK